MTPKNIAGVDVGTNSVLLTIGRRDPSGRLEVLRDSSVITRLGQGLGRRGALEQQAMARTLTALEEAGAAIAAAGATARAVGTSALRRADNGAQFLEEAQRALGLPLEVLSGEEEARLGFLGATSELPGVDVQRSPMIVDPGGGSTEVADGSSLRVSLEIGAVRLTEAFLASDPPRVEELEALRRHVRAVVSQLQPLEDRLVIGVGGTATTLAAIDLGLKEYRGDRVHGHQIGRETMVSLRRRLAALPLAERVEIPCLPPGRADIAVAGAMILEALLERLGVESMVVSDRGLRFGLMLEIG
jgi:exopolyphosphatase / guanosine-5'-triphosphate,3'-diphosphate pyrophosphatase